MRFPWLQVDADFIAAHAGDLGAHLGIGRREAIGLAVDLWTWALARAPDDAPPDGVVTGTGAVPDRLLAGSVGWAGPEATLTDALVACGLAVRIDGGYRLTGFSRYKATWEKNRRRPVGKPDRNRTGTGEKPERKTQTQTQTQKEDLPDATDDAQSADPSPPAANGCPDCTTITACWKHLERPKPGAKPPRAPSKAEVLYGKIQDHRRKRCESAGEAYVEDRWEAQRINRDLGAVVKGTDEDRERFEDAFTEYLADDARAQQGWSLSYFMKGGVRSMYEKRALDAKRGAA